MQHTMKSSSISSSIELEKAQPDNPELLLFSDTFKKEAWKVAGVLFLFFIVYLVLFAGSIFLAIGLGYLGGILIMAFPRWFTIVIGFGLGVTGLMVIIYLIKFLFSSSRDERSAMVEVKESDLPDLFLFIRRITTEVQAPFPKKIFLSSEVNASVSYNSSFWSMFFPVRKNLVIGLGLVNSLSLREFEAVMAHEFGHFSQKSMKLGSYIYHVNRAIYNLLFENQGYETTLHGIANLGSLMAMFSNITIGIVNGIHRILQWMYLLVNKHYFSLARQMEFHADSVAVYMSGGESIISSLKRIEFGSMAYNSLLSTYEGWQEEKLFPENVYAHHKVMMTIMAEELGITLAEENLPQTDSLGVLQKYRQEVTIEDQWASHPSIEQRAEQALSKGVSAPQDKRTAWELFSHKEQWQKSVSDQLVSAQGEEQKRLTVEEFQAKLSDDKAKATFPAVYQGFFDRRDLPTFSTEPGLIRIAGETLESLFHSEVADIPLRKQIIDADLELLPLIMDGRAQTNFFDFRGHKYPKENANEVEQILKQELEEVQEQLNEIDRNMLAFISGKARENGTLDLLTALYDEHAAINQLAEDANKLVQRILNELNPIFAGEVASIDRLENIFLTIAPLEQDLKLGIRKQLSSDDNQEFMKDWMVETFQNYIDKKQQYVLVGDFNQPDFVSLLQVIQLYQTIHDFSVIQHKRKTLTKQLELAGISHG